MATSEFCAVARMALPSRDNLRNRYTLMEMAKAIAKLMSLFLPIFLATLRAARFRFLVRLPIPIRAAAMAMRPSVRCFGYFLSMLEMWARKYVSSGAVFFLFLESS